jgi:hypothetical protein
MAETSATIIDLSAYRARKRMELERARSGRHAGPSEVFPIGFYFFWPVLAWMPLGLLLVPTVAEDFA